MDFWASLRLHFDIESDPPQEADLATLRKQASPLNLQLLMLCGAALGVVIAALFFEAISWPRPVSVPVAVLAGLAAALPFLYWAKIADILAGATHPLGREELRIFAEWCTRDERVARYFRKILRQGRRPVYGDFAALVDCVGLQSGFTIVSASPD